MLRQVARTVGAVDAGDRADPARHGTPARVRRPRLSGGRTGRSAVEIDVEAARIAEYLVFEQALPHAIQLYAWLGGGGDIAVTQKIAGWATGKPTQPHHRLRLISHIHTLRGLKAQDMADILSPLVVMGWLEPDGVGQRQATKWTVNQQIYRQFADRTEREKTQRAQIQALIADSVAARRTEASRRCRTWPGRRSERTCGPARPLGPIGRGTEDSVSGLSGRSRHRDILTVVRRPEGCP